MTQVKFEGDFEEEKTSKLVIISRVLLLLLLVAALLVGILVWQGVISAGEDPDKFAYRSPTVVSTGNSLLLALFEL